MADDEAIMSLLCRVRLGDQVDVEEIEFSRQVRALAERRPDLIAAMRPGPSQVKKWLRNRGLSLGPGESTERVPILSLEHPDIRKAIRLFATKLFCSLYYKHAGRVLGATGRILHNIKTNGDLTAPAPLEGTEELFQSMPLLKRNNETLNDQFFYSYGALDDWSQAAFFACFRHGLAMTAIVVEDGDLDAEDLSSPKVLMPFNWRRPLQSQPPTGGDQPFAAHG
ncbi:MAG: hypothetical protein DI561_03635 [Thauera sp.]|nr:MAG: hypothetical protein DI561_03635 [Thauera sp.]